MVVGLHQTFSSPDRPIILVFLVEFELQNSDSNILTGALNTGGIQNFGIAACLENGTK